MNTPLETLLTVANVGGRLGVEGDRLRMLLPPDASLEIKEAVRRHKPGLLELLLLNFVIVRSDAVNATLFWTPDNDTRDGLIEAGVAPGIIYTAAELGSLLNKRVTASELPAIHAAKDVFSGRLVK